MHSLSRSITIRFFSSFTGGYKHYNQFWRILFTKASSTTTTWASHCIRRRDCQFEKQWQWKWILGVFNLTLSFTNKMMIACYCLLKDSLCDHSVDLCVNKSWQTVTNQHNQMMNHHHHHTEDQNIRHRPVIYDFLCKVNTVKHLFFYHLSPFPYDC